MSKVRVEEYRKGRWRVRVNHKGRTDIYCYVLHGERKPFRNEDDAQTIASYVTGKIANKSFDPSEFKKNSPFDFGRAYQIFVDGQCHARQLSLKSYLKNYFQYFKGMDIREVRDTHLMEWANWIKEQPLADYTKRNARNVLKRVFSIHRGALTIQLNFPAIHVQRKNVRWIPADVQDQVFSFIPKRHQAIFTFIRFTGCRPGEACTLKREDVQNGLILFDQTKTDNPRSLPVIPEIEWTLKPKEVTPWIFSCRGKQYQTYKLSKIWRRARKKAGVEINLYNAMRHSFGTQRAILGAKAEEIQAVLGHTSSNMTQRYVDMARKEMLANVMRGKVCRVGATQNNYPQVAVNKD